MTHIDYRADNDELAGHSMKEKLVNDQIMQAILTSGPAEIDHLVDKHVTDMQSAREVLKRICLAIRFLYKEQR